MTGPDGGVPLSDREAAYDARITALMDRVGQTEWVFAGGDNFKAETTSVGFCLDPAYCVVAPEAAAFLLPIWDDEGNLYDGYNVDTDEEVGVTVDYEGPLDAKFERVVDAMVALAKTPEAIEADKAAKLGEQVVKIVAGSEPAFIRKGRTIVAMVVPTTTRDLIKRIAETDPTFKQALSEAQAEAQNESDGNDSDITTTQP